MSVAERYAAILRQIAGAAERAGRDPGEVRLIGAAKRQPEDRVRDAVAAGLRDIGENFVQEASRKQASIGVSDAKGAIRWHLIGRLQRNKAREAVALFTCIHSVDRVPLVEALEREALRAETRLDVLLQVNVSREPQKAGVAPEDAPALLDAALACRGLRPVGLMTMPAPDPDPESARGPFATLRELRDRLREQTGAKEFRELSMGMSGDLEVAVEEGATMVRIGTALFGAREAK